MTCRSTTGPILADQTNKIRQTLPRGGLPGPRRGLRRSQRPRGRAAVARLDRRGTRSRRSNPRRFPSTRGTTGTTTTPPASSYTLAVLDLPNPAQKRAVRRPAARWVGQPWVPWRHPSSPGDLTKPDASRLHGVSSTEVRLPSRRLGPAPGVVVTRAERRGRDSGGGSVPRDGKPRSAPAPRAVYPRLPSYRYERQAPPVQPTSRRTQSERVRGGGVRGGVRRAELHSGARCGRRALCATTPRDSPPVGGTRGVNGAGVSCVGLEHARRNLVERWAA